MRCRWQQGYGFSSLPQPIKRQEALKNDAESGGVCRHKILGTRPRMTSAEGGKEGRQKLTIIPCSITLDIRLNSSLHLKIFLLT